MRDGSKHAFARHLRRTLTDAERRLWYHLRDRRLDGWKFRRQVPIGPFVADFACLEARVVVEVDGGQHADGADAARDAFLRRHGFAVLRFWNNDVLTRTQAVLATIHAALPTHPHPGPLPQAGEGNRDGDWTPMTSRTKERRNSDGDWTPMTSRAREGEPRQRLEHDLFPHGRVVKDPIS